MSRIMSFLLSVNTKTMLFGIQTAQSKSASCIKPTYLENCMIEYLIFA